MKLFLQRRNKLLHKELLFGLVRAAKPTHQEVLTITRRDIVGT